MKLGRYAKAIVVGVVGAIILAAQHFGIVLDEGEVTKTVLTIIQTVTTGIAVFGVRNSA